MDKIIFTNNGVPLQHDCDHIGQVSDGYHTFDELYEHRCLLFCLYLSTCIEWGVPWKSRLHPDGSKFDGWFIAGINLGRYPAKASVISYHLPDRLWDVCPAYAIERAPAFDGHTSQDVLERITACLKGE